MQNNLIFSDLPFEFSSSPVGYRVPPQDTWTRTKNWANNANIGAWDTSGLGFTFTEMTVDRTSLWFPGAGYRHTSSGVLTVAGIAGYLWCSSPFASGSATSAYFFLSSDGLVKPSNSDVRADGLSVRCVSALIYRNKTCLTFDVNQYWASFSFFLRKNGYKRRIS